MQKREIHDCKENGNTRKEGTKAEQESLIHVASKGCNDTTAKAAREKEEE